MMWVWLAVLMLACFVVGIVITLAVVSGDIYDLKVQMNLHRETWEKQFRYNQLLDESIGRVEDRTR